MVDEWMDRWMNGQMERWVVDSRWMDEWIEVNG
jgi:hypothetical protein